LLSFEDSIERRFRRAAELFEATGKHDVFKRVFSRYRAEAWTIRRQRIRRATECRRARERAPDRIEVVLHVIPRHRFNDQSGTVILEHFRGPTARTNWIAHVVQTIEERNQIILLVGNALRV